ncbi:MAG: type II/IV secretion system protein [Hahellaceae bacterium]|nr:type II/IV secretion system protein [Hahellaceae bacterium]MCP5213172.1 type II/IV secretion system protein [Hahellaceae bacterium]
MQATFTPSPDKLLTFHDFVNLLAKDGIIDGEQRKRISARDIETDVSRKKHPLELIAQCNMKSLQQKPLDIEFLSRWLATHSGQPYYRIDALKVDARAIAQVMSFAFAQRHEILAVEVSENYVTVASAQPFRRDWEENLRHVLKKDIRRVVTSPVDIKHFTVEFYQLAKSVEQAQGLSDKTHTHNFEQMMDLGNKTHDANDQHIVSIVDWLFQYAYEQRASDIHIEPRREVSHVRFRIDGVLHNVYEFPAQVGMAVLSRLKILGRLNIAEKRKPQDGRIKTRNTENQEVELRLSTLPTVFGEKLVMRIFDPEVLMKSFPEMGFSQDDQAKWEKVTQKPHGIILVTGPTGSGKTTTLYSTLKHLATPEVNICTIEDPIEMVEPLFNQTQVQHAHDVNFATGIRALMRQDPDIVMIGEIRDLETAEMAIQAALTGHLVLSTLHTNDAPSAITRLLELGIPPYLIRATVLGVMAQRLVRTLCSTCKASGSVDEKDWQALVSPWKASPPKAPMQPVGCLECRNTGYRGRAGVYEVMLMSEEIHKLVDNSCDVEKIRIKAIKEGMHSLRLSGAQKVSFGLTTIEEVMRVTPS